MIDDEGWTDMHKLHGDEKLILASYRVMKRNKWYLFCYVLGFFSCAFIVRFII
jgi:hypothetical protein